jgi:hypothetical protein
MVAPRYAGTALCVIPEVNAPESPFTLTACSSTSGSSR